MCWLIVVIVTQSETVNIYFYNYHVPTNVMDEFLREQKSCLQELKFKLVSFGHTLINHGINNYNYNFLLQLEFKTKM